MTESYFATGRCLCGKVSYTISAAPRVMSQCHGDDCRKATGTGHASNAFLSKVMCILAVKRSDISRSLIAV